MGGPKKLRPAVMRRIDPRRSGLKWQESQWNALRLGKQMTTDARRLLRPRAVASKEHSVARLPASIAKLLALGLPSVEQRVGQGYGRPYEGLSRMRGNSHVRFLGGRGRATARAYPADTVGIR